MSGDSAVIHRAKESEAELHREVLSIQKGILGSDSTCQRERSRLHREWLGIEKD
jgi:hypothetical protein